MGKDRTLERRKAKIAERLEKRLAFEAERAKGLAECLARKAAIRSAYEKEHPGENKITFFFRGNKVGGLDFSGPPVPFGGDVEHPDKGVQERTAEMNAAFEKAAKEPLC